MPKKEIILCFAAHNDDHLLGAGGTLAKYAEEGKICKTYVFSYGESSHFWLKGHITQRIRAKEAMQAERMLGGTLAFFGLTEGNFKEQAEQLGLKDRIAEIITANAPSKIFTHNLDDPHPDHRAVYSIVMDVVERIHYPGHIYSFNIWNFFNIRKRHHPKMIVDISSTFKKKMSAFKYHKSQKATALSLLWNIYRRDVFNGFRHGCRFAEVFYKIQ